MARPTSHPLGAPCSKGPLALRNTPGSGHCVPECGPPSGRVNPAPAAGSAPTGWVPEDSAAGARCPSVVRALWTVEPSPGPRLAPGLMGSRGAASAWTLRGSPHPTPSSPGSGRTGQGRGRVAGGRRPWVAAFSGTCFESAGKGVWVSCSSSPQGVGASPLTADPTTHTWLHVHPRPPLHSPGHCCSDNGLGSLPAVCVS